MCTLSWLRNPQGFDLLFNRDEKRVRPAAEEPTALHGGSTRMLAPRDGEAGGSWIAANEHGLVVALLNGYHAGDTAAASPRGAWTSRGHLVIDLARCASVSELGSRLDDRDLGAFRSFHVAAFDPADGLLASWHDGNLERLGESSFEAPLLSSSYRYEDVAESRRTRYRENLRATERPTIETVLAYHRSHHPERGPFSTCMHREDARTVSFTWVRVDRNRVSMRYSADAPCRAWPPGAPLVLERSRVSA